MTRLNITLPDEIAHKLEQKRNKSRFIVLALQEKFERDKKIKIERLMEAGYSETRVEDKEISDAWDNVDTEKWD